MARASSCASTCSPARSREERRLATRMWSERARVEWRLSRRSVGARARPPSPPTRIVVAVAVAVAVARRATSGRPRRRRRRRRRRSRVSRARTRGVSLAASERRGRGRRRSCGNDAVADRLRERLALSISARTASQTAPLPPLNQRNHSPRCRQRDVRPKGMAGGRLVVRSSGRTLHTRNCNATWNAVWNATWPVDGRGRM